MVETLKPPPKSGDVIHHPAPKSNRFTDADIILYFYGELKKTAAKKREATNAHTLLQRQFKSTGTTLGIYNIVTGLVEQDDPEAFEKFLAELMHIFKAFQAPVGTQFQFFDGPNSAVNDMDKAFSSGRMRGVSGEFPDEQAYPEGPLHQEHLRGWTDGQKVHQDMFIKTNQEAAEADAAKKVKADEKAKAAEERAAEKVAKAGRKVEKTEDGEAVH